MTIPHCSSLETRPSQLKRLQSGDDPQSWQEFYRIYGGLIRHFALKAGLSMDEAEEVAKAMKVTLALVCVTRFRVTSLLKREVRCLERAAQQALRMPS